MAASRASEVLSTSESESSLRCPSCGHDNPQGSNFCNQCGAPVHFRMCEACEAINDTFAYNCHKCHRALPQPPVLPSVYVEEQGELTMPRARDTSPGLLAVAALLAVVALLFFAYQDQSDAVQPVTFVFLQPESAALEVQQIAVDADAEARLAASTQDSVRGAESPRPSSRKPPSSKAKSRAQRSGRAA